jgi:seryl-tRNA synthetase
MSDDYDKLRTALLDEGLLVSSGVPGVYGRGASFVAVFDGLEAMVRRAVAEDRPESLRFPPVLPRELLDRNDYLVSFPHLAGTVSGFPDGVSETATDLAMVPAACYPAYPAMAARGPLPAGGVTLDLGAAWVFRREPSPDPARMQAFHQREVVRLGEPATVAAWRDAWRDRAVALLRGLGLDAAASVATDPFFGRAGRLLARSQREQELKFEVLVRIAGPEPTAVASFNYHQDHFAARYGVTMAAGGPAHTACLGFGLERITIALLVTHGLDVGSWPVRVRTELGL